LRGAHVPDLQARVAVDLANIRFQSGDLMHLPFEDESFDTAVCVFGIFFVPDGTVHQREQEKLATDLSA
jgi:ubiquinone/menaquinone biosynthesis C-methylase UbiE